MARRVRVHGVRREFDIERYAAVVIALAKHLATIDAPAIDEPETATEVEDEDDES